MKVIFHCILSAFTVLRTVGEHMYSVVRVVPLMSRFSSFTFQSWVNVPSITYANPNHLAIVQLFSYLWLWQLSCVSHLSAFSISNWPIQLSIVTPGLPLYLCIELCPPPPADPATYLKTKQRHGCERCSGLTSAFAYNLP